MKMFLIKGLSIVAAALLASSGAWAMQKDSEVRTVESVDLNQYIGQWYEVASIPQSFQKQCIANTTAEYSFAEKGRIKVLNSCDTQEGKRSIVEGRAKIVDQTSNAKLKVTFVKLIKWVFPFGGKYWILEVGPNYSYAVVGDPTREYAWILSRTPSLNQQTLSGIESRLRQQGYDTSKILTSIQSKGFQKRVPLSDVVKQSLDIVDTAIQSGQFKTLLTAVQVAGLENTLRSEGPFTVFAPTDAAFAKIGQSDLNAILQDKELLTQILAYHVVPGYFNSTEVVRLGQLKTVNGKEIVLSVRDGKAFINDAELVALDVPAANGIIHVIDTVLVP
jgi:apolipoprotein D and lipocalin family protein